MMSLIPEEIFTENWPHQRIKLFEFITEFQCKWGVPYARNVLPCLETIQLVTTETADGPHFLTSQESLLFSWQFILLHVSGRLRICKIIFDCMFPTLEPHSQQQQLQQGKNSSSPAKCSAFPSAPHDFLRRLMIQSQNNSAGTSTVQDSSRPFRSTTLYICCSLHNDDMISIIHADQKRYNSSMKFVVVKWFQKDWRYLAIHYVPGLYLLPSPNVFCRRPECFSTGAWGSYA